MSKKKKKQNHRPFNWENSVFRKFLVKFSYIGTLYHGNAYQHGDTPTVEKELFNAMCLTKAIKDRVSCGFSRCARTDKGVHSAGNYYTINLRVKPGAFYTDLDHNRDNDVDMTLQFDYPTLWNSILPTSIKIHSIQQMPANFDARFSCLFRSYEYYFPCDGLDVERMNEAAQSFVGRHNFRNFCKMDMAQMRNFTRDICHFSIERLPSIGGVTYAVAYIKGLSFLWHQVRCMMSVLFSVGADLEDISITAALLDIEHVTQKPQYPLASEDGLILKDCIFDLPQTTIMRPVVAPHTGRLHACMLALLISQSMCEGETKGGTGILPNGGHVPILNRPREPPFEPRLEQLETLTRELNASRGKKI